MAERALVLELEKRGWWASRVPASGKRGGFDVVAARGGRLVLIEVKAGAVGGRVYLERERWERALSAAATAGAEAYLAVRESGSGWRVRPLPDPDSLAPTAVVFELAGREKGRWMGLDEAFG